MSETSLTTNPAPAPHPAELREPLWARLWPHASQLALGLLLMLFVALLAYRAGSKSVPAPVIATVAPKKLGPMDLNAVDRDDLLLLPGIGDKLAQRIVDHRENNGPFKKVDDLRSVAGIGALTLQRLRPLLYVVGAEESETAFEPEPVAMMSGPRSKSKKEVELAGKRIRINDARAEELQRLPGIGPKLAQRIIDHRQEKGLFRSIQDLRMVAGIGPKTLEKLKPHVSVESASVAVNGN